MPTNRIPVGRKARGLRVTPEAIELFERALEIEGEGLEEAWADEGGRRREYLDTCKELAVLLGLRPWQSGPCDWDGDPKADPDWFKGDPRLIADRRQALEIRARLLEAIEAKKRGAK